MWVATGLALHRYALYNVLRCNTLERIEARRGRRQRGGAGRRRGPGRGRCQRCLSVRLQQCAVITVARAAQSAGFLTEVNKSEDPAVDSNPPPSPQTRLIRADRLHILESICLYVIHIYNTLKEN